MKKHLHSTLWLFVLGCQALPVLAGDDAPRFKRMTAPGQILVQSIDEQDLPPSLKEAMRERIRLSRERGIIPVRDDQVPDFAALEADFRARGKPFSRIVGEKKLTFSPANIDATSLSGHQMPEALVAGIHANNTWTGLSRMFHPPSLRYVMLDEYDLVTAGGGAVVTKEWVNADINGAPATLVSTQASPEKSETRLSWFANGMSYLLRAPGADDQARGELLEIARGISK